MIPLINPPTWEIRSCIFIKNLLNFAEVFVKLICDIKITESEKYSVGLVPFIWILESKLWLKLIVDDCFSLGIIIPLSSYRIIWLKKILL